MPEALKLKSCPKQWSLDLDKAVSPEDTCAMLNMRLAKIDRDIVAEVRRIDSGRLGIPVYMSICGADARAIMPVRKQMGKGSSPAQAQASALMELMERYAFFSFWNRPENFQTCGWREAKERFNINLISAREISRSVNDSLPDSIAEELLNLTQWRFYPATRLNDATITWLPLDWFRMLGEFNGSSAGNTREESILQGLGELVERHVCCIVDIQKPLLPTIDASKSDDSKLQRLLQAFKKAGIKLILKDMSLSMPMPTVAALAWDPATFPDQSEIVFTAGTATSPAKAAIRAITEVAQLGGDFHTGSCYEASGLSKYSTLEECAWILNGLEICLDEMPSLENNDILLELQSCVAGLEPLSTYVVETTDPLLKIPAHYCIVPGLQFRERAKNQSLGLFVGRKLAEEAPLKEAMTAFERMEKIIPSASHIPFFRGLALLNNGHTSNSVGYFKASIPLQTDDENLALAEFYTAYALTAGNSWEASIPYLESAIGHSPAIKEYHNLLGVARFKTGAYEEAEQAFTSALKLDKGSAMDLANRGICRKLQGKKAEALEDLQTALELEPSLEFILPHLEELLPHAG